MAYRPNNQQRAENRIQGVRASQSDFDYDEGIEGGDQCASYAASRIESNIDVGRAIDMMNGDEDHDEDHVEKYL